MKNKSSAESLYRLYILIRTDLPSMNPGRAMAQAAHAANQFIHEYGKQTAVRMWQQDAKGFGTTICLAATEAEISNIVKPASIWGYCAGHVYDPTYKFELDKELAVLIDPDFLTAPTIIKDDGKCMMFRNELTCGYLFMSNDSPDKERLIGSLSLHP